jgi:iron-sulfur cluster assembly accessory protein
MIRRLFSTTNKYFPITITDNAWSKIYEILNTKTNNYFLFSAIGGGCNGFNYNFKLIDREKYNKLYNSDTGSKIKPSIIENENKKVIIDPMSEMFLFGTTIDYISENYNKGIFENKFVFIPDKNLASTCGCGISFTPK